MDQEEITNQIKQYIHIISYYLSFSIKSKFDIKDSMIRVYLDSDYNSILIGKRGRTLEAIQTWLRKVLCETNFTILVDVGQYCFNRDSIFLEELNNMISDVIQTELPITLDPMNSYYRRLVHQLVKQFPTLKTQSIGQGTDRRVIISVKESE